MKLSIKGPSRQRWRRAFVFAGVVIVGAAGAVVALGSLAAARPRIQKSANDGDARGKQIWAGNCAGCHGLDGRGGERGPNIATNPEIAGLTDEELSHIVRDGSPNMAMPALGRTLSATEIVAVVKHLRTLQGDQHATALPGDPKAGRALFYGKAECSSCHMVEGIGGFLGPDLSDFASTRAPEEIRNAIIHPEPDPRAKTATVYTRDGAKYLGIIRNEDNFSLQLQTTDGSFHLFDRKEIERVELRKQSLMPSDFGTRLSPAELNDLVSFLMATSRAREATKRGGEHKTLEEKDDD
jgi:cytochrome c oxidase cbb3-type subunit III